MHRPWQGIFTSPTPTSLFLNTPPSTEEISLIQNEVATTNEAIRDLDSSINKQLQILRALVQRKEVFVSFRDDHARLLNPMFRIPPEIWTEIFKYTCGSFSYDPQTPYNQVHAVAGADSLHRDNPVNVIDRVCAGWRQILRSSSEMWSRPILTECCRDGLNEDLAATLLSRFLEHSGVHPLHVTFAPVGSRSIVSPTLTRQAMSLLMQHHRRWKSLDLNNDFDLSLDSVFTSCISSTRITVFPLLEELNLKCPSRLHDRTPWSFPNLIDSLPKLRKASFEYICPGANCLPWRQLQHVTFIRVPSNDLSLVIRDLVEVVSMTVIWNGDVDPPTAVQSPYTFPQLEKLQLSSWKSNIFAVAKTPKLRDLCIRFVYVDCLPPITSFIRASECQLISFTCTPYNGIHDILEASLVAFLSSLPLLEGLIVNGSGHSNKRVTMALLKLLKTTDDHAHNGIPLYCPALRWFCLDQRYWGLDTLRGAIIDVAVFRWKARQVEIDPITGVETVRGLRGLGYMERRNWRSGEAPDKFQRLRKIRKEGLKILYV